MTSRWLRECTISRNLNKTFSFHVVVTSTGIEILKGDLKRSLLREAIVEASLCREYPVGTTLVIQGILGSRSWNGLLGYEIESFFEVSSITKE